MDFLYLKALHIVFVVTWFAGLFYIVRLFVYFSEANSLPETERNILQNQYKLMQKRLWYGISWPSMILTHLFGTWMLFSRPGFLQTSWMLLKLSFVFGLILYHVYCHKIFNDQRNNRPSLSSFQLRLWNEVATLFLVAIVFIVVLKDTLSWIYGLIGLFLFALLLLLAIRIYKNLRNKK
jgi:protoporphyrinogen IX oxidase